jgi:hypothetical protein
MYYNIAMNLPPLPLDVQSFKKISRTQFLYVDKTGYIARLINSQLTYFFLSRPRRFGKSLLVSTMKEIFNCSKELFKNLRVYKKIQWQPYPVIHFDFSLIAVDETIPVKKALEQIHEKKYGEKYRGKGKDLVLVGVSFSKEERNIKDWIIEKSKR